MVLSIAVFLTVLPVDVPAFAMIAPTGSEWMLLCGTGLLDTTAHLLMTLSLRHASAATSAPMQYPEIPFATAIGWIVFRNLPDGLAASGIMIIMLAGL